MVWPFNSNNQQNQQQGAMNLGLANGQQQVPQQGQQQWGQQQYASNIKHLQARWRYYQR